MPALTRATLQKHMRYDPEAGHLIWTVPTGGKARAGQVAGCLRSDGYRFASIFGKGYLIHHLVWLYHRGELPPKHLDIDHKDGDRANSRIDNLRLVSRTENLAGGRGRSNPILPGVMPTPSGRYASAVHINGKRTYLGTFDTPEEAYEVHKAAHVKHFGEASKFHPNHPRKIVY